MLNSIKEALFGKSEDKAQQYIIKNWLPGLQEYLRAGGNPNALVEPYARGPVGIKPRSLPIWACIYNFPEGLWALLDAGANHNSIDENDGLTLLHAAAKWNDVRLAMRLLHFGVDPNGGEQSASSPLYIASARNHLEVAKVLIEAGADVNRRNWGGTTPLEALGWAIGGEISGTRAPRKNGG